MPMYTYPSIVVTTLAGLILRSSSTWPAKTEYLLDDDYNYGVVKSCIEDLTNCTLTSLNNLADDAIVCVNCGALSFVDAQHYILYVPYCQECVDCYSVPQYNLTNLRIYWPELLGQLPIKLQDEIHHRVVQLLLDKERNMC